MFAVQLDGLGRYLKLFCNQPCAVPQQHQLDHLSLAPRKHGRAESAECDV